MYPVSFQLDCPMLIILDGAIVLPNLSWVSAMDRVVDIPGTHLRGGFQLIFRLHCQMVFLGSLQEILGNLSAGPIFSQCKQVHASDIP